MQETIFGALLPMVVTFLLGFVAAWREANKGDIAKSWRSNVGWVRTQLWRSAYET